MQGNSEVIKAVILDIDQTIYNSRQLNEAYFDAMIELISKLFAISKYEANNVFSIKKEQMQMAGKVISSTQVLIELGISIKEWVEFSCLMVDPGKYLGVDFEVIRILEWLCSRLKVIVISNNNLTQLRRTYEALGVSDYLMGIKTFSLSEDGRLKPDITLFSDAINFLQVPAPNILAVGDREDVDLVPARLLGLRTYQVKRLEHFYSLDEYIKNCY